MFRREPQQHQHLLARIHLGRLARSLVGKGQPEAGEPDGEAEEDAP
jgi:hypothetical protein